MDFILNVAKPAFARFPINVAGENCFYTIYTDTGAVFKARSQDGIVEYPGATFAVKLKFTVAGNWVIVFDIDGTSYSASDIIAVSYPSTEYGVDQREFELYNSDKSVKKVRIKKYFPDDPTNVIEKELSFEYNSDKTVKTMIEVII